MLTYNRATGVLLVDDDVILGRGWAGQNIIGKNGLPVLGLNNPDLSNLHNVGPLPAGRYKLTNCDSEKGPYTIHLEPLPNEDETAEPYPHMLGRAGFLIHGWTMANPFASSEGCMCMPYNARKEIWDQRPDERILEVI